MRKILKFIMNINSGGPKYEPDKWNSDLTIRNSHNCYSYFLNDISKILRNKCNKCLDDSTNCPSNCDHLKPQPGNCNNITDNINYDCQELIKKIKKDNPKIIVIPPKKFNKIKSNTPIGYYLGAVVQEINNKSYHFYRKDRNGFWSHKPGQNNATNLDAEGKVIYNLLDASKSYNDIKYKNEPCCYFYIPYNSIYKTNSCVNNLVI